MSNALAVTSHETIQSTGPGLITRLFRNDDDVFKLGKEVFHGVKNDGGEEEFRRWIEKGEGVGVHMWEKAWQM